MRRRILNGAVILVASAALACAGSGTSTSGGTGTTGNGGFGAEGNLPDRGGIAGGAEKSDGALRTIYFGFDDYGLGSSAKGDLQHNARVLKERMGSRVEIQGNCDERGTEEYNLALGKKRAEAAKRYLVDLGIDGSRISTISFGEENPAVRGHSESAWSRNRRDDFVLR